MAYSFQTDLAEILKKAGLPVIEEPGWKKRGRPASQFSFRPTGIVRHWDASSFGSSNTLGLIVNGNDTVPGPLANFWTCRGCKGKHPNSIHVIAAGRANHAGVGIGYGTIKKDRGNELSLGWEIDQTVNEPWPVEILEIQRRGEAAIMKAKNWKVATSLCGHDEYAAGRKIDVSGGKFGLDMSQERKSVAVLMAPPPKPPVPEDDDMPPKYLSVGTENQTIRKDGLVLWDHEYSDGNEWHSAAHAQIGPFKTRHRVCLSAFFEADGVTGVRVNYYSEPGAPDAADAIKCEKDVHSSKFEINDVFSVGVNTVIRLQLDAPTGGTIKSGTCRLLAWEY